MSLLDTLLPARTRSSANQAAPDASAAVRTVQPVYEVKETPEAFGVTVSVPGVAKDGVEITAEDGQLRILARRAWQQPDGWRAVYRESADAAYELVLTHDNAIDPEKIAAELRDGVLRVSLPKQEALKPRKIAVS